MSDESVEETLAWRPSRHPRCGRAVVAAVATLVGGIVSSTALSGQPHVPLVTALQNETRPGADTRPSLRTPQLEYIHDHAAQLILGGVLLAIGLLRAAGRRLATSTRATKAGGPSCSVPR